MFRNWSSATWMLWRFGRRFPSWGSSPRSASGSHTARKHGKYHFGMGFYPRQSCVSVPDSIRICMGTRYLSVYPGRKFNFTFPNPCYNVYRATHQLAQETINPCSCTFYICVPDHNPDRDPPDPGVFGHQRSGSSSVSGSRSYYTFIPTIFWLLLNFYIWKIM